MHRFAIHSKSHGRDKEPRRRPSTVRRGRTMLTGVAILVGVLGIGTLYTNVGTTRADAQTPTPCAPDLLVPQHTVQGHLVGETACQITNTQTVQNSQGKNYKEVDIALSGTAFGYADPNMQGNTRKDLTDAPNILYPQFGITSWEPGIGTYSGMPSGGNAGAGLTILYPDAGTPWNGKVFVLAHGQSNNTPIGQIVPQAQGAAFTNDTFDNLYADQMINKGYAVIYTRRPASSGVSTRLDNGTVLDESLNDNVDMLVSFTQTGQKFITSKLGKAPTATYEYGHSAGVILGRLANYSGLNYTYGTNGKPVFDGFFSDDPGGGLPLPLSMPEGEVLGEQGNTATFNPQDKLFQTKSQKAKFTKELTFAHGMYQDTHSWLPQVSYLNLKREGAQLLQQEGVGNLSRTYEINGVSHIANTSGSPANTLDIGGLVDQGISLLDQWVQKDIAPPATVADLDALSTKAPITTSAIPAPNPGAKDNDKELKKNTIELPPIACPTGVRYAAPAPAGGSSSTGYAAFDGTSLEPVTSGGALVDVNGNGYRDKMPTINQAWQMLGLIGQHDTVTKSTYLACVKQDVNQLTHQNLLSKDTADWYVQQSQSFPNLPW